MHAACIHAAADLDLHAIQQLSCLHHAHVLCLPACLGHALLHEALVSNSCCPFALLGCVDALLVLGWCAGLAKLSCVLLPHSYPSQVDKYEWIDLGSSFVPSELVGAFLHSQLLEAEAINARRRRVSKAYHQLLQPLEASGAMQLMPLDDGTGVCFASRCQLARLPTQLPVFRVDHG